MAMSWSCSRFVNTMSDIDRDNVGNNFDDEGKDAEIAAVARSKEKVPGPICLDMIAEM